MAYLLDANVFIEAKNRHYCFDFCPAFWEWVAAKAAEGRLFTTEKVGDELLSGDDMLVQWAQGLDPGFFLPPTTPILDKFRQLVAWATSRQYRQDAVARFLDAADSYLIATAAAHGHVVVTHERPAPDSLKDIKIPDGCVALGVKYMTPFEMLRLEHARFVLLKPK